MSGPGSQRPACSCPKTHCITGNCRCFRANLPCCEGCSCNDCRNTAGNKAETDSLFNEYSKRRTVPSQGGPDLGGCGCWKTKCTNRRCDCFAKFYRCTSKCRCQDCDNPFGIRGSDTNTEPRQGDTGGVSNVHDEAESKQANATSSMAKRPAAQMEKQATESRDNSGSDQNKRPRSQ